MSFGRDTLMLCFICRRDFKQISKAQHADKNSVSHAEVLEYIPQILSPCPLQIFLFNALSSLQAFLILLQVPEMFGNSDKSAWFLTVCSTDCCTYYNQLLEQC